MADDEGSVKGAHHPADTGCSEVPAAKASPIPSVTTGCAWLSDGLPAPARQPTSQVPPLCKSCRHGSPPHGPYLLVVAAGAREPTSVIVPTPRRVCTMTPLFGAATEWQAPDLTTTWLLL